MRILWASPNTLLDTSNGAAMMVRECAQRNCVIRILGGSIFVNPEGMAGRGKLWAELGQHKGKFIDVQDGLLKHRLLVTQGSRRRLMHSYEEQRWFDEYRRQLETERPDMVFFFDNSLMTLLVANEARRRGVKVGVFLMHGNNHGQDWRRDVDWIFTDTNATAQMYRSREGYDMTPLGAFVEPESVRAQSSAPRHVLFINPIPGKGGVLVVQLAFWLKRHRPDIQLEVVDTRKTWRALVRQVSIRLGDPCDDIDNVIVAPNTLDMRPLYERARLLLVPSLWWESGPRVIVEALLNGIPVIGSNSGGIPEVLGDGGEIIDIPLEYREAPYAKPLPAEIVGEFAQRICIHFDDNARYREASARARAAHAKLHDLQANGDRLLSCFHRCLQTNDQNGIR